MFSRQPLLSTILEELCRLWAVLCCPSEVALYSRRSLIPGARSCWPYVWAHLLTEAASVCARVNVGTDTRGSQILRECGELAPCMLTAVFSLWFLCQLLKRLLPRGHRWSFARQCSLSLLFSVMQNSLSSLFFCLYSAELGCRCCLRLLFMLLYIEKGNVVCCGP